MSSDNPWKLLESRIVYETPWLRVRDDRVIQPDGASSVYTVIELPPSIAVVVLNDRDQVALVGQWRYTHQRYSWEIPTGGCSRSGEAPLEAAQRELAEEVGVAAESWRTLGTIDNSNGSTTDTAHLFLARGLGPATARPDAAERLTIRWVGFDQAIAMVMSGEITESGSAVALLKAARLRAGLA